MTSREKIVDKDKPRVQFSLRFDNYVELLERVKEYCEINRMTLTEFTAAALENALETEIGSLTSQLSSHDKITNLEQSSYDIIKNLDLASHDKIKELEAKIAAIEENLGMTTQRLENMDQRLGK